MLFLQFSRPERNGAILLAICCLLSASVPVALRYWYQPPAPDFSTFDRIVDTYQQSAPEPKNTALFEFDPNTAGEAELLQLGLSARAAAVLIRYRERGGRFYRPVDLCKIHSISAEDCARLQPYVRIAEVPKSIKKQSENRRIVERFPFDPNTVPQSDLLRLGIPEWVARNIIRYREKGGRFRSAADLAKIYGMPEEIIQALEPLVNIPEQPKGATPPAFASAEKATAARTIPEVDINRDGADTWDQLPGIGAARARQILNFREKLGGFSSVEQIAETRGLPDSIFQAIRPYLSLSPVFRKIPLNTIAKAALAEHPYVSFKQADLIIAYREQHGPFQNVDDIRKIPPLNDPVWLAKIRPYLSPE